jgi:hypothetical protein
MRRKVSGGAKGPEDFWQLFATHFSIPTNPKRFGGMENSRSISKGNAGFAESVEMVAALRKVGKFRR